MNSTIKKMTNKSVFSGCLLLACSLLLAPTTKLAAQATGRVEFTARVAPTDGRPEPVRQLTFSLLRKSFEDIRAEALQSVPAPDLGKFIDGLSVSPELKAWMKKHNTVQLAGNDFTKSLSPEDIVNVPEFFDAYVMRNLGDKAGGIPAPKYKEKDRIANPQKYEQEKEQYKAFVQRYIAAVPESVQGIDADLLDLNPYTKWQALVRDQHQLLEARLSELAQGRYLAAQTDTDLDGHGFFSGIAPGNYWIAMLGAEAISGDVRLRWDVPVSVRPGETAYVELSNFNAVKPSTTAQNSTYSGIASH
jgi:hypothetical protein